jgi:4-alpha-glucanotransferase
LLHVTSLPGPHGIGDLGPSARHFVDWLVVAGQRIWQWLPVSPIGPGNSPYMSVSAFAGSPLMVALEPLVAKGWLSEPALPPGGFDASRVDFARVVPWRSAQLRAAARGFEECASENDRAAFEAFRVTEAGWLDDYALFMALESAHSGKTWWEWAGPLARREGEALTRAKREHAQEIRYWSLVQWWFHLQASELRAYANARGVELMADLPIYLAHHSVEVWVRPDLFALDEELQPTVVAGVPPDPVGPMGQRWGNPLYRWDRMAEDGFAWWTARIARTLVYADALRIDHFRAFARYWEIPADSEGAGGGRWASGPGKALFDAVARALGPLPVIAEDLAFIITPDVHALREGCGFPGMKVLLFGFGSDGRNEYLPHNYSPDVVAYTGTHDNDTALGFWDSAPERQRIYAQNYLGCRREDVHWAMIRAVCHSVAKTVIHPMQDVLGLDGSHRMNTAGTFGGSNWTWRFHWDMVGPSPAAQLARVTAASGRGPFEALGIGPQMDFPPLPPDDPWGGYPK